MSDKNEGSVLSSFLLSFLLSFFPSFLPSFLSFFLSFFYSVITTMSNKIDQIIAEVRALKKEFEAVNEKLDQFLETQGQGLSDENKVSLSRFSQVHPEAVVMVPFNNHRRSLKWSFRGCSPSSRLTT